MTQARVVVGIDGSAAAQQAMLWAVAECIRRDAALLLAHATGGSDRPRMSAAMGRCLQLALAEAKAYAGDGSGFRVSAVTTTEQPAELLIRLGEQADLLVVGSYGSGGQPALLGSVAHQVAAGARCPVLVVPGGWDERANHGQPVVVGVPASVAARGQLYAAFELAGARGVPVCAVRTWSQTDWSGGLAELIYTDGRSFEAHQQEYVELMLQPMRERYPAVSVRTLLSEDRTEEVLLRATARASLLVLGSRFVDGSPHGRLDSATTRLMQLAPCPVLVLGRTEERTAPLPKIGTSAGTR